MMVAEKEYVLSNLVMRVEENTTNLSFKVEVTE